MTHLHGVEIQIRPVAARCQAGCGTPSHANAVCRPPDLDDEHADLGVIFLQVLVIDLTQPSTANGGFSVGVALML